jgi:hypothetical protein
MIRQYILDDDNRPLMTDDMLEWARFFENMTRRTVGHTQINSAVMVSTVFLGLDHRHRRDGPPLLFETMIFGGPLTASCWRYVSWDDAEAGHRAAVRKARVAAGQKVTTQ